MPVQTLNIPTLPEPQGYTHVAVATGTRMVFLAGQVARGEDGSVVGVGDLAAQVEQAIANVVAGLEIAGATFADVAKTTIYVVDWHESKMQDLFTGFGAAAGRLGISTVNPVTLVPVPCLSEPDHLVEIEVTAVVS